MTLAELASAGPRRVDSERIAGAARRASSAKYPAFPTPHTTAEPTSVEQGWSRASNPRRIRPPPNPTPTARDVGPCHVRFPPLAPQVPTVALGPTRANVANVAYLPGSPPVVGTSRNLGELGRGNSRALEESLFCLSGFSVTPSAVTT